MRLNASKRSGLQPRRYFVPYFVLVVGLLSTAFFSYYVWRTAEAKDLERFNTSAQGVDYLCPRQAASVH